MKVLLIQVEEVGEAIIGVEHKQLCFVPDNGEKPGSYQWNQENRGVGKCLFVDPVNGKDPAGIPLILPIAYARN